MSEVTLGGERLGSGNKQKVHLRNYERSSHDIGFTWRSTMSAGTLVPFWSRPALPGSSYEINLDTNVITLPSLGPLLGSYKVQLDVFLCPIRNYQGQLHMNKLGVGLDMAKIKLPLVTIQGPNLKPGEDLDSAQINSSCIFNYLGIRGLGYNSDAEATEAQRSFNAVPWLAYWDIYKQYYSNKMEEVGAVIHNDLTTTNAEIDTVKWFTTGGVLELTEITGVPDVEDSGAFNTEVSAGDTMVFGLSPYDEFDPELLTIWVSKIPLPGISVEAKGFKIYELFQEWYFDGATNLICSNPINPFTGNVAEGSNSFLMRFIGYQFQTELIEYNETRPKVTFFRLENIDRMRELILTHTSEGASPFRITNFEPALEPYNLTLRNYVGDNEVYYSAKSTQEGLGLKTYQSDLFNNWLDTEWIDGENGINEITKVSITDDSFTIDEFMLSRKIYDMLNRIAVSGGTYDDWLDAVYTHERVKSIENPMYMGGLIKELAFQEVTSQAMAEGQPLGTLAGKGRLTDKNKGGRLHIRVDEPSYIIGIVSITPRIDYSQGNQFDVNLKTMNDFHKPALDGIGFQDLITDQMAYWDTNLTSSGLDNTTFRSAGKQPAWINYMTDVNKVKGKFADKNSQMFMVLNRRYDSKWENDKVTIADLTTYIDPSKFNHIFADTQIDAQNFWVQIKVDCTARMKMSATVIPNL